MDFIIELILEIIIDCSVELSADKKVKKRLRYPALIILIVFYLAVVSIIVFTGIKALKGGVIALAIIMFVIASALIIGAVYPFFKKLKNKKDK